MESGLDFRIISHF